MDAPSRRPGLSADKLALLQRRVGAAAHRADRAGAIPRRAGDAPARLSFAQRRLWFLDQLAPNNPFYNIACAVRLRTFLNVAALRAALAVMVRRHEALRTTFTVLDGEPRQVVAPTMAVELPVSDLRHLPIGDREDEAVRLATEEARQPFDLARGPLMRARLLTLGDQDFLFVLCMHHIVSDGWSMGVFIREFNAVYAGLMAGRPAPLPPMPIQYADFAEWQRGWLTAERLAAHVEHWRQRLEDLPTLALPTDRPRPKTKSYRGALHAFTVPAATCLHLRALCEATGATPFMALAAAFAALLRRYSGQDDIVIGAPIANRNHADIEGLIGFFVNSVVLRMDTGGDAGLRELTERTKQVTLAAYQHQDVPFETLVEALQPERDTGRNPLFQVTFQLLNTPGAGEPQAAALNTVQLDRRTAIFDIAFTLMEQGETLVGGFEYSTDLFNADTMARMAEHFVLLLDGALREPDRPIGQLPLLTGAEHRLLAQWNDTAVDFPADDLLHRMFEARVAMAPDAVAVRDAQGEISYGELDRRANRLARHLHAHGPGREVPVGVCLPRSIDLVVALLAVLKRGAAYVPIAPDEPAGRIATMVERAGIGLLLTRSDLQARLPANAPPCVLLDAHRDRIDA
ncbi:MAG: amino acid adenylation enzyme/thioester reductase family protein, partial [Rhizobacter sp.]|nr:amino acid adenylation enzyme/thioester reductase family protein [Rhizobacter sp.]